MRSAFELILTEALDFEFNIFMHRNKSTQQNQQPIFLQKSDNSVGFITIYTSDKPDPFQKFQPKNPFIEFKIPINIGNDQQDLSAEYLKNSSTILSIIALGMLRYDDHHHKPQNSMIEPGFYTITVTGNRKVAEAIKLFRTLPGYSMLADEVNYLTSYQEQCESNDNKKLKTNPLNSKSLSLFTHSSGEKSGEKVDITLFRKTKNHKLWLEKDGRKFLLKIYNGRRKGRSQFEHANGLFYKLLLGPCHSEVNGVHGNSGEEIGFMTELYPTFTNFETMKLERKMDQDTFFKLIISSAVIKVLALTFTEKEYDLPNNIGFVQFYDTSTRSEKYLCVKIDDEKTMWPVVCRYFNFKPDMMAASGKKISEAFSLTQSNIDNFLDGKIENLDHDFKLLIGSIAQDLFKNSQVNRDMHYMLLKRLLVPEELVKAMSEASFNSQNMKNEFMEEKNESTSNLKTGLLNNPKFKKYFTSVNSKKDFDTIINEFIEYNNHVSHDSLKINLGLVRAEFDKLINLAKPPEKLPLILASQYPYSPSFTGYSPLSPSYSESPPTTPNTPDASDIPENPHPTKKMKIAPRNLVPIHCPLQPTSPLSSEEESSRSGTPARVMTIQMEMKRLVPVQSTDPTLSYNQQTNNKTQQPAMFFQPLLPTTPQQSASTYPPPTSMLSQPPLMTPSPPSPMPPLQGFTSTMIYQPGSQHSALPVTTTPMPPPQNRGVSRYQIPGSQHSALPVTTTPMPPPQNKGVSRYQIPGSQQDASSVYSPMSLQSLVTPLPLVTTPSMLLSAVSFYRHQQQTMPTPEDDLESKVREKFDFKKKSWDNLSNYQKRIYIQAYQDEQKRKINLI